MPITSGKLSITLNDLLRPRTIEDERIVQTVDESVSRNDQRR